MYSVKSYYEITLIKLLTFVIFAHSVKIQCIFLVFFIAMTEDREIIQKKQITNFA